MGKKNTVNILNHLLTLLDFKSVDSVVNNVYLNDVHKAILLTSPSWQHQQNNKRQKALLKHVSIFL